MDDRYRALQVRARAALGSRLDRIVDANISHLREAFLLEHDLGLYNFHTFKDTDSPAYLAYLERRRVNAGTDSYIGGVASLAESGSPGSRGRRKSNRAPIPSRKLKALSHPTGAGVSPVSSPRSASPLRTPVTGVAVDAEGGAAAVRVAPSTHAAHLTPSSKKAALTPGTAATKGNLAAATVNALDGKPAKAAAAASTISLSKATAAAASSSTANDRAPVTLVSPVTMPAAEAAPTAAKADTSAGVGTGADAGAGLPAAPAAKKARLSEDEEDQQVLTRIRELKDQGLWGTHRLPMAAEPARRKVHWDYLLEEAAWLANDFRMERKWKIAAARKVGHRLARLLFGCTLNHP